MGGSEEFLDLSTIWVALGMARDNFDRAFKGYETAHCMLRRDEMQRIRDCVEDRMRMLTELEEYDYGL